MRDARNFLVAFVTTFTLLHSLRLAAEVLL